MFAAGLLTLATPASAQGLFEMLFGGFHRHAPPEAQAYADPLHDFFRAPDRPRERADSGPASAYCVRTSDGFYFPVQSQAGLSAADACHAFCPASRDAALFRRRHRQRRRRATAAATPISIPPSSIASSWSPAAPATAAIASAWRTSTSTTDPTLRPGDIVATRGGLVAVTAVKNKVADFAPLGSDRAVPTSTREKLAGVKIMPTAEGVDAAAPIVSRAARALDESRRAQLVEIAGHFLAERQR